MEENTAFPHCFSIFRGGETVFSCKKPVGRRIEGIGRVSEGIGWRVLCVGRRTEAVGRRGEVVFWQIQAVGRRREGLGLRSEGRGVRCEGGVEGTDQRGSAAEIGNERTDEIMC